MPHSKAPLTSSGLNLAVPTCKCENIFFFFFCTQECLKSTQQANPIEIWTTEPKCAHMWVRPFDRPSVNFF